MTRTISLITAMIVAALLLAVPALGDDWAADQHRGPVGYVNPDSADRAAALEQEQLARMLDARERSQTLRAPLLSEPSELPTTPTATSPGRDFDLRQIGIGFAMGVLLAFGLSTAVRFTRVHRLAH